MKTVLFKLIHLINVAIADEVASKETLEVQNNGKPGDESVHLMDKSRIPGNISNSRNPLNQHNQKPSLPTFQKSSYACYSCGSTMSILEPSVDFEMLFAVDVNALAILFVSVKKGNTQNNRVKQKLDSDEVFLEKKIVYSI